MNRTPETVTNAMIGHLRVDGFLPEADRDINALARYKIRTMRRKFGRAFLYDVNLYGEDRHKRDRICREYCRGMVFNFGASLVAPTQDETLIDLIHERDNAEYTGTRADYDRVERIFDRAEKIGAVSLHWT